jgi:hypothetical protein
MTALGFAASPRTTRTKRRCSAARACPALRATESAQRSCLVRKMTKSAVRLAGRPWSSAVPPCRLLGRYSRKDYTQPQLFALLVLRQFLRTDYRGLTVLLTEWDGTPPGARPEEGAALLDPVLRRAPPACRRGKGGPSAPPRLLSWPRARRAGLIDAAPVAAVDATGLEARHVSLHYRVRRAEPRARASARAPGRRSPPSRTRNRT